MVASAQGGWAEFQGLLRDVATVAQRHGGTSTTEFLISIESFDSFRHILEQDAI